MKNRRVITKEVLDKELENFQYYIDEDYFDYDDQKDMTLGYINQSAEEVIAQIKNWDFSPLDNLIWHYTRIELLKDRVITRSQSQAKQSAKEEAKKLY